MHSYVYMTVLGSEHTVCEMLAMDHLGTLYN